MAFETGRAAAAKKWIAQARPEPLGRLIDAFPQLRFYRARPDDDFEQKVDLPLPPWYRAQRQTLIGPCFDEPGAVWDARLRFARCDQQRFALEDHFRGGGDRDWFLLTHFGFASGEDRHHLYGLCGLLPIGVRFGYHLHLAISVKKPTDRRIFAVHLAQVDDAVSDGKPPKPQAVFNSYASMLASIGEVRKGGDGEIIAARP